MCRHSLKECSLNCRVNVCAYCLINWKVHNDVSNLTSSNRQVIIPARVLCQPNCSVAKFKQLHTLSTIQHRTCFKLWNLRQVYKSRRNISIHLNVDFLTDKSNIPLWKSFLLPWQLKWYETEKLWIDSSFDGASNHTSGAICIGIIL